MLIKWPDNVGLTIKICNKITSLPDYSRALWRGPGKHNIEYNSTVTGVEYRAGFVVLQGTITC